MQHHRTLILIAATMILIAATINRQWIKVAPETVWLTNQQARMRDRDKLQTSTESEYFTGVNQYMIAPQTLELVDARSKLFFALWKHM